jgi:hypothetical protein
MGTPSHEPIKIDYYTTYLSTMTFGEMHCSENRALDAIRLAAEVLSFPAPLREI